MSTTRNSFVNTGTTQSVDKFLDQAIQKERESNLEMIADFSHELKKPLSIIRGLLSCRGAKASVEKFTEITKEIDIEITRTSKILDDMMKALKSKADPK
jgi:signal transduction histidine kinase